MALTLREMYETYVQTNHTIQESTKARTRRAFLPFLMLAGDVPADKLSRADVAAYQSALLKAGKATTTVNSYTAQVSAVFGWFVGLGILDSNPFIGSRKVREPRREVSFYEATEMDRLFEAIEALAWRDPTARIRLRAIVMMAYHAGLRIGEILNLRWLDIDLENALVKVQYRPTKPGEWWAWGSKGLADRAVPMSQELLEHYYRLQVVCPWMYPHLPAARCRTLQRKAEKLSEATRKWPCNNLYRLLNRVKRYAGISEGAFHELRRTAATELSERLQPTDLQKLMGHKSFATTQRYIGVRHSRYLDATREAMNARCHTKDQ